MTRVERWLSAGADDVAWWVVFLIFSGVGASALGLSIYLRGGGTLTTRAIVGTVLHSLVWGVVVFLMGYSTLKHDVPMLLGLSILSGMGGASFFDLMLMLVKNKFGISVSINPPHKTKDTDEKVH
ncbi:MAG: hypothetical protein ACK4F4_07345 [Hylemonella sp.]|uniref:hypothetical protein n=1 Tax=Hylemonella sp. TaxID=2066020 RepID=UPI00391D6740